MFGRLITICGLFSVLFVSGCRYKGAESFESATTPIPAFDRDASEWKGDPYALTGVAEASGGTRPDTPYSAGARPTSDQKTDPTYNRPEYGTGTRRGELSPDAAPGHAQSNAPALQGGPITENIGNR